jgi:hypothetical protein
MSVPELRGSKSLLEQDATEMPERAVPKPQRHEGVRCPGCNRYLRELDVFHARDCSSKQSRLEGTLWETMPLGGTETVTMKTKTKTEAEGRK